MFYVYMILMKNNNIYTGHTNNIFKRFLQHYNGIGARTTRNFGVKKLLHLEFFKTKKEAIGRELKIKEMNKQRKLKVIDQSKSKLLEELSNLIIQTNIYDTNKQIILLIKNCKNNECLKYIVDIIYSDEKFTKIINEKIDNI